MLRYPVIRPTIITLKHWGRLLDGEFFGLSEGYWLRGQARFDTDTLAAELAKIKPWASGDAQAMA